MKFAKVVTFGLGAAAFLVAGCSSGSSGNGGFIASTAPASTAPSTSGSATRPAPAPLPPVVTPPRPKPPAPPAPPKPPAPTPPPPKPPAPKPPAPPAPPKPPSTGVRKKVRSAGPHARGIDVSVYQGTIDWSKVKASGVKFGIARVSHGLKIKDTQFARNWSEMKKHGLVRGCYQYFAPNQSATAQALLLCKAIGKLGPGDLPPVLDVEERAGVSPTRIRDGINTWVRIVKSRTGLTPIVYTSPGFWNPLGFKITGVDLWVAHWFVSKPTTPSGWSDWWFWQKSDKGRVPGINAAVDLDEFHGTAADLNAFVGK